MKNYFQHKLNNLISINKIVTIHYFEFDKNFCTQGEAHDFWEIVYAEKESLLCSADGKQFILEQGELLFHKPNEFHTLAANGKNAPNVFILSFVCKSESMKFFEGKIFSLSPHLVKFIYPILEEGRKTFDIPYSDPNLKKMKLLPQPTLGGEQLIKNYLEIFLINLLRDQTETEQGNTTFLPWKELSTKPIDEVTKILKENVYSSLSIDDICSKTNYSKAYLFRIFKAKTGKTIMTYFIELKINQAKQLLRENELSVREISENLAFNTPDYFTKTFKRITGLTPLAYKKRSTHL
ncbi:MAG: helix-turn-helix domain-containing protein [Clostridiales bacterium]|nr:helix-turn-helix domain-containing protein [Clostridiales bacterium]